MTTRRQAKLQRRTLDNVTLEKEAENNSNDENKYVNNDVELTFDVLTIIFKNLNARDLYSAARVCRSWNEAAENEKRVRGATAVAFLDDLNNSWMDTEQFNDRLRMKPMLGLMFTRPFDDRHPATKKNNADCPCRVLPSDCPNIIVGNYGVVKDETELEEDPQKATWMLLPHDKDVIIETICVPVEYNKRNSWLRRQHIAIMRLRTMAMVKNKVKCFIMMANEDFTNAFDILGHMPRDQERSVSGGVVCNLALCKQDKSGEMCSEPMGWIAILISGPSVRSWSVVLKRTCDTKDKILAKLKLLRGQVHLRKHSMGFMFACQGRGEYMFRGKNVESTAFKKVFPEVPLVGSFGGGEYGDSTVAFECTSASILHRIYDCHLRLIVNHGVTCIWNRYGVNKESQNVGSLTHAHH